MRSVPPRGSGWVLDAESLELQAPGACCHLRAIVNASETHPLPRGGTDLMISSGLEAFPTSPSEQLSIMSKPLKSENSQVGKGGLPPLDFAYC